MKYVIHNEHIISADDAKVEMNDRGYHFGDGIYEVIRIYNSKPFTMDEHLNRLIESANKLDLNLQITKETLENLINKLVEKNELTDGMVYIQMTRGVSPRNHLYHRTENPILSGFTQELSTQENQTKQKQGISAWVTDDIRWLRCDIKSINLLGNVMAKREAADHHCQEAILHRDGMITEGSSSNLFLVKDQTLYTHPATNLILNGITRQIVLKLAESLQFEMIEEAFPKDVIEHADEAFITSTTMEVMPIIEFKGGVKTSLKIGPITEKLQEAFQHYKNDGLSTEHNQS
ncbi:D-alanine aminotransferase [Bacillus sp. TS-2]|nr:D-alanine aminotransferase [Bacillus sp. TS-2]